MVQSKTKQIIAVLGPTAVGKTQFSIELARFLNTEIISADSRQFYKEMSIGTAVPTKEDLQKVPHHFIQHISIQQVYTAGDYQQEALQTLEKLFEQHNTLILTGGSGLYIDALLYGLDTFPEVDPTIRKNLNAQFQKEGIAPLQEQLGHLDLETFAQIDIQNPRRLIRALEVCIGTGVPFSSFKKKPDKTKRNFQILKIGIKLQRETLYKNIDSRVLKMMENGLVEEARRLYPMRQINALQTVGYKELFRHFDGDISLIQAIEDIQKNTRRYAKRQLTWLRKKPDINWILPSDSPSEYIENLGEL
ncbi:tRNA dimethylallyltransferase [Elysia marginata]|uniref:tRNA dimethylallyltransferase n=1 Tax=Elysia marginata TaxID=1093978 RepID=A0AAV4FPJ6_9GAST|nr:tRNA dimethylallyltransferase [Elysia marginata]